MQSVHIICVNLSNTLKKKLYNQVTSNYKLYDFYGLKKRRCTIYTIKTADGRILLLSTHIF